MTAAVEVVDDVRRARTLLHEGRLALLAALDEPASAATIAKRLGQPRQRVNYHLRELEEQRLLEIAEERRRGNCVERVYRRTGKAFAISPDALGALGSDPDDVRDRFSAAYQIALGSRIVREVGALQRAAHEAGKALPTFTLDTEVRFASPADRAAFADDLADTVARLVERYHDADAPGGRRFRVFAGAHSKPRRGGAVANVAPARGEE